jgi:glutamine synthetase
MDSTDRNRTSPFEFTGNKFEFRMVGSNHSISGPNLVLNTIVAEALKQFADELENAKDFNKSLNDLVAKTILAHKRIIFNGNNYSSEWVKEAENRGLLNLKTTDEVIPYYTAEKNISLFVNHGVFSEKEVFSRAEIKLENYIKILKIEAKTLIDIAKTDIAPCVNAFLTDLGKAIKIKSEIIPDFANVSEIELFRKVSTLNENMLNFASKIETVLSSKEDTDRLAVAKNYTKAVELMQSLRLCADEIETLVGKKYWPMPTYADLLFSV